MKKKTKRPAPPWGRIRKTEQLADGIFTVTTDTYVGVFVRWDSPTGAGIRPIELVRNRHGADGRERK